jgi:hypothetical protein
MYCLNPILPLSTTAFTSVNYSLSCYVISFIVMSPGIGGIGLGTTPSWPLQRNLSFPQHQPVHQNQAFK